MGPLHSKKLTHHKVPVRSTSGLLRVFYIVWVVDIDSKFLLRSSDFEKYGSDYHIYNTGYEKTYKD